MLELKQLEVRECFADIKTIQELQALSHPRLHEGTIMNAINRQRVLAIKKGGDERTGGIWLISFASAKSVWSNRF